MGVFGQLQGNNGNHGLMRLLGYQDVVSLDSRGRFRIPDDLAGMLQRALGSLQRSGAPQPPAVFERLSLYFVPGTQKRIFLYPAPNIRLAVESFDNPPPGLSPDVVRRARDYFYLRMRFVEADKQNRLVIPEGLREHAGIDEHVQQITLVAQNYWLALSRTELMEQRAAEAGDAFEEAADEFLDPVRRPPSGLTGELPTTDQQS